VHPALRMAGDQISTIFGSKNWDNGIRLGQKLAGRRGFSTADWRRLVKLTFGGANQIQQGRPSLDGAGRTARPRPKTGQWGGLGKRPTARCCVLLGAGGDPKAFADGRKTGAGLAPLRALHSSRITRVRVCSGFRPGWLHSLDVTLKGPGRLSGHGKTLQKSAHEAVFRVCRFESRTGDCQVIR